MPPDTIADVASPPRADAAEPRPSPPSPKAMAGEGGPPSSAAKAATEGKPNLREIPDRQLQVMAKTGLAALLKALGEPTNGTRRELYARVIGLKRAAGGKGHVHGKTPCILRCGGHGVVQGVHDGKRHFKCSNGRCNARWSVAVD